MRFLAVSIAALATMAIAGCGDDDTKTVVSTKTVTTGTSTSSTTPSDSGSGEAPTETEEPTQIVRRSSFKSPTGNIGCMIVGGTARCDIDKRSWSAPRPADCPEQVDYGQGLEVGTSGEGKVVCAGDTARDPGAQMLPYTDASQVDGFRCTSKESGMTCTNRKSGHGFTINMESYKTF